MVYEKKTDVPFCSIQHKILPRDLVKCTTNKDFSCTQFNKMQNKPERYLI